MGVSIFLENMMGIWQIEKEVVIESKSSFLTKGRLLSVILSILKFFMNFLEFSSSTEFWLISLELKMLKDKKKPEVTQNLSCTSVDFCQCFSAVEWRVEENSICNINGSIDTTVLQKSICSDKIHFPKTPAFD